MKLLEKILLPTDFSDSSENIIAMSIELAKNFNSEIILIHVLPKEADIDTIKDMLIKAAYSQLENIRKTIESEGVKTAEPIIDFGSNFDKIVQAAESKNVNIILIGAGQREKLKKFQLGTTAEKIIQNTDKPVWVVKQGEISKIKNILCPVDFSAPSKRALDNAIHIARRFKAELIVFSVYKPIHSQLLWSELDLDEANDKEHSDYINQFDSFLNDFNFFGVDWEKEVRSGEPNVEILKAISENESDLLVMGTTGRTGFSKIFIGSITEKVIREVPCSFITTKSEDVISMRLETEIRGIEQHYKIAEQLFANGYFNEAIKEFMICLKINDMHLPSLNAIADIYEKLGKNEDSLIFRGIVKEIEKILLNLKIEDEIRGITKS